MANTEFRSKLEKYLESLSIETTCVNHPAAKWNSAAVYTLLDDTWLLQLHLPTDGARDRSLNCIIVFHLLGCKVQKVFTVEEMMPHLQGVSGAVTKNLFLKDKKKKGLWLVSVRHDRQVNLNDLAKKLGVGSGNLRFAEEAAMLEKLKVGQGCATALALFCDTDNSVKFVLDSDLVNGGHERVYFHPMTNEATMGMKPEDLLKFLKETGHEPVLQNFD